MKTNATISVAQVYPPVVFTEKPHYVNLQVIHEQPTLGKKDGERVISLLSDRKKVVINILDGFYPYMVVFLNSVMHFYSEEKNRDCDLVLINVSHERMENSQPYKKFIVQYLEDASIPYRLIERADFDFLNIDNFTRMPMAPEYLASDNIYSETKRYAQEDADNKKVFVSRKNSPREFSPLERRCNDHDSLEEHFSNLGFEIVYAEDFLDFRDQIKYFSNVSVLAGLTGAGLTNSIFMKPGSRVIELFSKVSWDHTPDIINPARVILELHHYYRIISFFKEHRMLTIPFSPDSKITESMLTTIVGFSND